MTAEESLLIMAYVTYLHTLSVYALTTKLRRPHQDDGDLEMEEWICKGKTTPGESHEALLLVGYCATYIPAHSIKLHSSMYGVRYYKRESVRLLRRATSSGSWKLKKLMERITGYHSPVALVLRLRKERITAFHIS